MEQQIIQNPPQQQVILAASFASKAKSKREVYLILTLDAGAYLPDYRTLTI